MSRLLTYRTMLILLPLVTLVALPAGASGQLQVAYPDVSREAAVARRILETPQVQSAMQYVDEADAETIQEWLSLCNAYGPSGGQSEMSRLGHGTEIYRSRLLYKLFRIYGLERVHIDDEGNVIGIRPGVGEGPTVVLNSHLDNVSLWPQDQPIEAFVADQRVWCPAARDDLMGTTQLLTVLRALNAADIETEGDVWFVGFTGEETGSPGAEEFIKANYPHNIDWRNGDILMQFHGGGGDGITTGSDPYIYLSRLMVFTPLDFDRWRTDAVDALGPLITRFNEELRDPRSLDISQYETGVGEMVDDLLYMNMAMVQGNVIPNGSSSMAEIRFDLRSPSEARLSRAGEQIEAIAEEVSRRMGDGFTHHYEVTMKLGATGVEGWDKVNNEPARMAAGAAEALYGVRAAIDPTRGCGDCRRSYMEGMPALSLRGNVVDFGEGGRFEIREGRGPGLQSRVRRKTSGHDVTESAEIVNLWSGIKHGLLFTLAYAGLAGTQ